MGRQQRRGPDNGTGYLDPAAGPLYAPGQPEGFRASEYGRDADGLPLLEIPWITTNFTAQWCLKAIVCLELIPDALPASLAELARALQEKPSEYRLYGA